MSETTIEPTSRECALIAARAADGKKATDIMVQEVRDLIGVTDYFVIATAANSRQVEAIVDEIEEAEREQARMKPLHREGTQDGTWSLLDYGSFVVHVFQPETREYYRLEALWNDAPVVDLAAEAGLDEIEYSDRIAKLLGRAYLAPLSVRPSAFSVACSSVRRGAASCVGRGDRRRDARKGRLTPEARRRPRPGSRRARGPSAWPRWPARRPCRSRPPPRPRRT